MHDVKRVDLGFLDTAPFRMEVRQVIKVPKETVFQYLKLADEWPKWHTGITKVEWTSPQPFGEGTTRTVEINNRYTAHEDYLLWDENNRFVFRFLQCDIPMARALAEDCRLEDLGDGTCEMTWVVAGEVAWPLRLFSRLLKRINLKGVEQSCRNLAATLENRR